MVWKSLVVLFLVLWSEHEFTGCGVGAANQACRLDDVGSTPGECVSILQCKFQKIRLRLGLPVKECRRTAKDVVVCCPTADSIAQQKCASWRQMLLAPISFDQPRFPKPYCAASVSTEFITGGRDANQFEYPHAVALGYGRDEKRLSFLCGATLISERFLLTAAHCLTNKNVGKPTYAVIGDRILDPARERVKESAYRKTVKIDQHIVHPEYKPPLIYNDIALLKLSRPLELDRYVLPACLATPLTSPKRRNQAEASGWGITDAASSSTSNILQAINISMIDTKTCNQLYESEADKPYRYPNGLAASQVCATGDGKDTCKGDSGGGLYTREDECLFHVTGITSIGSRICGLGNPAVYTNVAFYQDWIESIVWGSPGRG